MKFYYIYRQKIIKIYNENVYLFMFHKIFLYALRNIKSNDFKKKKTHFDYVC